MYFSRKDQIVAAEISVNSLHRRSIRIFKRPIPFGGEALRVSGFQDEIGEDYPIGDDHCEKKK
jgi:hypothetical protein